jgi:nucleoside-diphosphate-sugar epimerase
MKSILVTGATGLIGSNVCVRMIEQGTKPRTLARDTGSNDAQQLRQAGVDVVAGDIADMKSVLAAAEGTAGIIHCAAMLGRPGASVQEGFSTNVLGSINVYTAAVTLGGLPVVQLLTSTFFDMWNKTLTERSPLDLLFRNNDAYSVTKRLGFTEGVARVAEGQDIRFMIPGAVFGPSPCVQKAMIRPSFNDRIASAIRGELTEQIPLPVPFSFVSDCAVVCIAALEKGVPGQRYIAMGRSSDVRTIAASCNRACELAGVSNRVHDVPRDKLDDPDVVKRYGETLCTLGKRSYPEPFFDSSLTEQRLGYVPTALEDGLNATISWMRRHRIIMNS